MRAGKISASRCDDLMANGRAKDSIGKAFNELAKELAINRMGYNTWDSFTTWQTEWGHEYEPDARKVYEQSRGVKVGLPGYIAMDSDTGCTPDGLVGDEGMLEIKCPQWKAHTDYLINGCPKNYWQQIQFQLMVTGREWCDFMTFHPEMPTELKAKVFRIERDEEYIELIRVRVELMKVEINNYIEQLKAI